MDTAVVVDDVMCFMCCMSLYMLNVHLTGMKDIKRGLCGGNKKNVAIGKLLKNTG